MTRDRCPQCEGRMTLGFVVDRTDNGARVAHWQRGEPIVSRWWGVKQNKAEQKPIATHRCERCGLLLSYAL